MKDLRVFCADVGSVKAGKFGWASVDSGGAVAIWSTYVPGGHGTLAARFAWTEPEIIDDTGPEPDERMAAYGAVTVDTAGRAIAAAMWRRENDTNNDLWANRFE